MDRLATALGTDVSDLLPVTAPAETPDEVREKLRRLFDDLLERADKDVLSTLGGLQPLLRELGTRRR